tara:strand:- start:241 stop:1341 length:1101 start_codon:yes stop_codon:yes gene_type:complete
MIHGGLSLGFFETGKNTSASHCCLLGPQFYFPVDSNTDFFNNPGFDKLRNLNKKNIWDPACNGCKSLELANQPSMRTGMNNGLVTHNQTDLSGPLRIDLNFDISCNLACRSCGPFASTFWQKHLKDNGLWTEPIYSTNNRDRVIKALSNIDLSNLKQLVFCGGETLLGKEYWEVTKWLADNVPNAKEQLTICFQTNGTQTINKNYYDIIERFHLVKLHISLDGVREKFEYLRWPASWNQVTDNILQLRETLPGNVMFVIEETVSIYNLYYQNELDKWVKENFATNREGDITNHTRHMASGIFNLENVTKEYKSQVNQSYFTSDWKENPDKIHKMLNEIEKFDLLRNQNFKNVFPEVFELYARYLPG